ncbi:hypothetical protein LPJ64_000012 [Coemansia asiatica]|uniref:Major facilitator superfamily (MFS) profile domain-containing protein n=1 Tax=Coemansia asiatica TaxID=1052880 RepID=A0A9W7XTB8_9FUNG|nr:hypothetical protein LPJ64_000012 [Coemansia asiatica]KAJ2864349.1 hypothetical protein FB639_005210 [Coemansia asiatica]
MGSSNSYGVYLQEYQQQFPKTPNSLLSWIGSIQYGIISFLGAVSGVAAERYDIRWVVFLGSLVSGGSLIIASFCKTPWGLLAFQGIVFGIGGSFMMIPAMCLPAQWVGRWKGLATCVATTGGSIGGLWMSLATRKMVATLGWQWSLRINGLVVVIVGMAVSPLMKKRVHLEKREKLVDLDALKSTRFLTLFAASIFVSGAYFAPYNFMPPYAVEQLRLRKTWGANVSSVMNACGTVGRLVVGFVADYVGPLNVLVACLVGTAIAVFALWLPFRSREMLVVAAVFVGLCGGSLVSLGPLVTARLFGIRRLPSLLGLLYIANSIGAMVCSPVAGVLLDKTGAGSDYTWVIVYIGCFYVMSAILIATLWFVK